MVVEMEMYISNKEFNLDKVMRLLKQHKVLCNVIPLYSVVFNKKAKKHDTEKGCKIDIFNIEDNDMFNLYMDLRKEIGINCIWINTDNFSGCICEYKPFIRYEMLNNITKICCSEY